MLLTGQTDKYHNWQVTSKYLKAIFDHQKEFNIDVVLIPAPSRGTEWAATGKVKQKLPTEFSTETTILLYDLNKLK